MNTYPPHIEVIDQPSLSFSQPSPVRWYRSRRLIVFLLVFIVSASAGLAYNYSRPAVFQSKAVLLTSAMTAVDEASKAPDVEHVTIQRQILLGQELLAESIRRLNLTHPDNQADIDQVRHILQVQPIPETNLVEMLAEGTQPGLLPLLINTWIDVYTGARAADIAKNKSGTLQKLKDELSALEQKIETTRTALNEFRSRYDITSTGRDENEALARLKGLTASLNSASEAEVKAKAKLDAVNQAIAQGQAVVPKQDQATLAALEQRLQQLKEKLAEFNERYTPNFMALQPEIRQIPGEIKKLESEIANKSHFGKKIVRSDAEQDYAAAQQTVRAIREQLDTHKKLAADFSARFAEHERLRTDLEGLEKIHRETQERYVQIETQQFEKYPQVDIVERASLPVAPIRPSYGRDALIAVLGSLLLSLFSVWLSDYLTHPDSQPPSVVIAGIGVSRHDGFNLPDAQPPAFARVQQNHNPALESTHTRELTDNELRYLLAHAGSMAQQLICLLLCGLSFDEAVNLRADDLDLDKNSLSLRSTVPRCIPLSPAIKAVVTKFGACPVWDTDSPLIANELSACISLAAIDAGLAHPEQIRAESIRHTYIVYLVKQGLRLGDLAGIVGYLPASELLDYAGYSPPRPGCASEAIETAHPAVTEFLGNLAPESTG